MKMNFEIYFPIVIWEKRIVSTFPFPFFPSAVLRPSCTADVQTLSQSCSQSLLIGYFLVKIACGSASPGGWDQVAAIALI